MMVTNQKYIPEAPHYPEPERKNRILYRNTKGLAIAALLIGGSISLTSIIDELSARDAVLSKKPIQQEVTHAEPAHHLNALRKQRTQNRNRPQRREDPVSGTERNDRKA
ncbi:hypothetical protein OKW30_003553 [Paraburkholderia sp. Clong3]|uniref:hypothetical protein n=1 Tax=Paraburkholderia sp. Clong3 TaxID=2991061 RepID=UPI003D1EFCC8